MYLFGYGKLNIIAMKTNILFLWSLICPLFYFAQSDACSGAVNLPIYTTCSSQAFSVPASFTDGGLVNASCVSNTDREDGWYTIIATSTSTTVQATADKRIVLAAYSNCTTGELACSNVASGVTASIQFPTSIGLTYYIQLHRRGSAAQNMTGTICAFQTPPPPSNDDPCSAIPLTVNTACTYSTYTNAYATASAGITAPGCANYSGSDVWFSAVIPSTGFLGINSKSLVITDGGMAVYYGTCSSLTLLSCDDLSSTNSGNMPEINVTTRPVGSTIFIRYWENGNNNNGTFQLCASEINACGNDKTNDYCSNPATLTQGPGSWSSSTSSTYSPDKPGNMGTLFCAGTATIENNSWYRFTALSTTETFNFSSVSNCLHNKGIQAEVFEVTTDGSTCCTAFTSKSNYYNPGNLTLGVVTATGLTIGHTYILMVDGYSGDQCDFTVTNWTGTGILDPINLSIELIYFNITADEKYNQLFWETASEYNNDYFNIEKSYDGITFSEVAQIEGSGSTNKSTQYSYIDAEERFVTTYYRLIAVNYNGEKTKSEIVSVKRDTEKIGILSIYPNPAKTDLYIDIKAEFPQKSQIQLLNQMGIALITQEIYNPNIITVHINIENLQNGVYYVRYTDEQNKPSTHKFIIR